MNDATWAAGIVLRRQTYPGVSAEEYNRAALILANDRIARPPLTRERVAATVQSMFREGLHGHNAEGAWAWDKVTDYMCQELGICG